MKTYERKAGDSKKYFYENDKRITKRNIKADDIIVMIDRIGGIERSRGNVKGHFFLLK